MKSPEIEGLDDGWIRQGFLKRRSNYSPVILFETTDPKRLEQLKRFVLADPSCSEYDTVLVYDQWRGLVRLTEQEGQLVTAEYRRNIPDTPLGRRVSGNDSARQLAHVKAVLKEVDDKLQKDKTLFIIQNLSENREWETGLQSALRSWATDAELITQGSTIFLQTADSSALLDDFTRELVVILTVDPATTRERRHVIATIAEELETELPGQKLAELVLATAGLNLHQLESIMLESYFSQQRFDVSKVKELKSELVRKSGTLEIRDPFYSFRDIGGYQAVKDFIIKYIIKVLEDSERAAKFSLPLPKGILFFGPPGTGKSLFANALASEIQLPFLRLLTENIYSKWFGESGQRMKSAIRMAEKMSPAIVFVDEIDRFGKRTAGYGDSAGEESKRVFSQFLEWLGEPDRQAIIIGTTNVPDQLDEAFLRTGRFDYKIPFLYPGEEAREEILAVHLGMVPGGKEREVPLALCRDEILEFLRKEIVPRTQHFSCAELEELVLRTKRIAFDQGAESLGPEHFIEAASTFRIDEQQRKNTIRETMMQAQRFTDDQQFLNSVQEEMSLGVADD
ncbi:MAG: ATP-binding protein [Bacillota bacterium]